MAPSLARAQARLAAVVGDAFARLASSADDVLGVSPSLIVEPGDVPQVREVLRYCSGERLRVLPRGGGTKLAWADPPRGIDVVLSTRRLDRIRDHSADDLVVTCEAGARCSGLDAALRERGQRFPVESTTDSTRATIGGVIATNDAGPRRLRYGRPRDSLIGLTAVLADGREFRSGGRVVKNVAGYDLGKLLAGSQGTLAVIVDAHLKLHPRPAAQRDLVFEARGPDLARIGRAFVESSTEPSFVSLDWPFEDSGTLRVGLEGSVRGTAVRADELRRLAASLGLAEREPGPPVPVPSTMVHLTIGFRPAELDEVVLVLGREAGATGVRLNARIDVGVAVADVRLVASSERAYLPFVDRVRQLLGRRAHVNLREAPAAVKRRIGTWGPAELPLALMKRVRSQFDPAGLFCPERFVAGP